MERNLTKFDFEFFRGELILLYFILKNYKISIK
ncbi:hypothetical protein AQEC111735_09645 [Aquirufa ecclesiirivi]